jgi:tRNA nucleotidyltransferase (CCA-adding enzyme)
MNHKLVDSIVNEARCLMQALQSAGFAAYLVGGAVRDLLLGRVPKDFDIVTAALPDQVITVCHGRGWKIIDKLGKNFGVTAVIVKGVPLEVATFRRECYGEDAHRPEQVWYGTSLKEDLARRDFTINAMALSLQGDVVDPFGGQQDLARQLIRTVGNPKERFQEDALRMFRACRFAAQLGFTVDEAALIALSELHTRVKGLALERVRDEISLTLLADQPDVGFGLLVYSGLILEECRIKVQGVYHRVPLLPELGDLVGVPQNPAYHVHDVWRHTLAAVQAVPPKLVLRWAALLHDVAKGRQGVRGQNQAGQPTDHGHDRQGAALAKKMLKRLDLPAQFRTRVVWLVLNHMRFHMNFNSVLDGQGLTSLKHWVREEARCGLFRTVDELREAFDELAVLCAADAKATGRHFGHEHEREKFLMILADVLQSMPIHSRELKLVVDDVFQEENERKLIGTCLKGLLLRVQDGGLSNERQELILAARKWLKKHK